MNLKRAATLLAAVLVAVGLYLGITRPMDSSEDRDPADTSSLAIPAPDVAFETVDGRTESLTDYRGEVILLNLWGTWCPPCVREIPHLVEVQEEIRDRGGIVIGLAVDSGTPDNILSFWQDRLELEPAYPLWMTTNREAARHFDAFGLPNTLIIDREGVIRERFVGLRTKESLLTELEPYL